MRFEITAKCNNLADKDFLSKSDPMLIMLETHAGSTKRFCEIGRTEVIKNCLDPRFANKIFVDDNGSAGSRLIRVAVIDIDDFSNVDDLTAQEFIGRRDFPLSELLENLEYKFQLSNNTGEVTLIAVPFEQSLDGEWCLELEACYSRNDDYPLFLEYSRSVVCNMNVDEAIGASENQFIPVYRTRPIQLEDHSFEPINMSYFTFCQGDPMKVIKIECKKYKSNGSHRVIGQCITTTNAMEYSYCNDSHPRLIFWLNDPDEATFVTKINYCYHKQFA